MNRRMKDMAMNMTAWSAVMKMIRAIWKGSSTIPVTMLMIALLCHTPATASAQTFPTPPAGLLEFLEKQGDLQQYGRPPANEPMAAPPGVQVVPTIDTVPNAPQGLAVAAPVVMEYPQAIVAGVPVDYPYWHPDMTYPAMLPYQPVIQAALAYPVARPELTAWPDAAPGAGLDTPALPDYPVWQPERTAAQWYPMERYLMEVE